MEEYYRLVINLLKKHIDNGKTDQEELKRAYQTIDEAIEKAGKRKEDITELLKFRTDIHLLTYK